MWSATSLHEEVNKICTKCQAMNNPGQKNDLGQIKDTNDLAEVHLGSGLNWSTVSACQRAIDG